MTKVYIVMNGEYSDRRIEGVHSTRERAEAHAETFANARVEVFDMDGPIQEMPPGLFPWSWSVKGNGHANYPPFRLDAQGFKPGSAYGGSHSYVSDTRIMDVWARDEEHAIKIGHEWRSRIIAMNLWWEDRTLIPGEDF